MDFRGSLAQCCPVISSEPGIVYMPVACDVCRGEGVRLVGLGYICMASSLCLYFHHLIPYHLSFILVRYDVSVPFPASGRLPVL